VPTTTPRTPSPMQALLGDGNVPVAARGPMQPVERPTGPAAAILGQSREAVAAAQPSTERRLRPGVQQVGNLLVDPSRSLAGMRMRQAAEAERAEAERARQERLEAVEPLLVGLPENERRRVLAQSVYGVGIPQTQEEQLAELEAQLELRDRFDARSDNRTLNNNRALRAMTGDTGAPGGQGLSVSRATNSAEGIAASFAYDMLNNPGYPNNITNQSGQKLQPLVYVRANLREWARREGVALTEGEIQAIAADQLRKQEDQYREMGYVDPAVNRREAGRQRRGQTPGRGTPQPARTPTSTRGQRNGRVPARGDGANAVDPAVVQEGARRIRSGTTPEQLRAAGFSDREIGAMTEAARRR
jgi:hypothetical protein